MLRTSCLLALAALLCLSFTANAAPPKKSSGSSGSTHRHDSRKFDKKFDRFDRFDRRNDRFDRFDRRNDRFDRFDRRNDRFDRFDRRFDRFDRR